MTATYSMSSDTLVSRASRALGSFATLDDGWCYGDGGPVAASLIEAGRSWINGLPDLAFDGIEVFPGIDGEIVISVNLGNLFLDVTINDVDNYDLVIEHGVEELLRCESLDSDMAQKLVFAILIWTQCSSLASSTSNTIIQGSVVSRNWPSKSPAQTIAHPSLTLNVLNFKAAQSAGTYNSTILGSVVNRQYIGYSTARDFQQVAA